MDYDNLHINIKNIIDNFIFNNNIPHIIFHGPNGSGKKHLLSYLINNFYKNEDKKKYTLYINCAHDKGISFIRNELKYFSKSNLYNKKKLFFKSVILFNADKLTIDAQSALRRSIEKFSNTTRFFIIVTNKSKILKPIISRFCNIYVPYYNNINLYNINNNLIKIKKKKNINFFLKDINCKNISEVVNDLYYNGYNYLDLFEYLKKSKKYNSKKKYLLFIFFNKIKSYIKNDKMFLYIILYHIFIRKDFTLNNINNL